MILYIDIDRYMIKGVSTKARMHLSRDAFGTA